MNGTSESIDMVGAEPGVSCTWVSMRGRKRLWRWRLHRAGSTTVVCCRPCWIRFRVASFKSRGDGAYDTRCLLLAMRDTRAGGCTRQSLAENAMSRFKTLFGPKLSARRFDNQRVEAIIKCEVPNRMSSRGMPESVRIR